MVDKRSEEVLKMLGLINLIDLIELIELGVEFFRVIYMEDDLRKIRLIDLPS
ncbi:hypothetical protein [Calditerrivibrio nitroreducens]|uniref:Uncharacterized protein n=1 Tax=Calditerrivibrio nitroreducens (strain DSM 19672 / NBRC 101217 / Yu37-1) TaxID=768670 RepID=E4TIU9_CALNY|nr:hypothetical protein [Calditerrivibrio nitroreducens]ADR18054.1 hypothetical protein Calni_0140 [Calditerrivibrio nitroreducens DSM 19672]